MRLRPSDPPPATLALVAAVALDEVVSLFLSYGPDPVSPDGPGTARVTLKWPNDLLIQGAKLSGILLERTGDAVVIGFGVNLAAHPDDLGRAVTSIAAHAPAPDPALFLETLAEASVRWLARWRGEGLGPVRDRWLAHAHPIGAALSVHQPDGSPIQGLFDGLDANGALILRLADGTRHVMHAGDVFLI